jgi:phospholipid/cholesterol/gamma-HCH transport system permease protein
VAGATLAREDNNAEGGRLVLQGDWTLIAIGPTYPGLRAALEQQRDRPELEWDLSGIDALDSVGALMLWRTWGRRMPGRVRLRPDQAPMFERIRLAEEKGVLHKAPRSPFAWLMTIGDLAFKAGRNLHEITILVGQLLLDLGHVLRHPGDMPWRETSANLYKSGVRAMPVTALVGFLIGVVLSYLSALQLRSFGVDVYIINILGIGIVREMGPVLVAILVAGRSGSAMTAQLGVMRVTEEIDALAVMGVSRTLRLVFPKVLALALAVPLLVLWTSFVAIIGGMISARFQLDISYAFFIDTLPKVVPVANLWIALFKGLTFGILVALIASHFGLQVKPNTESLSAHTTSSVVTAITVVILVDAIYAIATRQIGMPTRP